LLAPGPRIASIASNRILLRDGLAIAALEAGNITRLDADDDTSDAVMEQALNVGKLPTALRPYYA